MSYSLFILSISASIAALLFSGSYLIKTISVAADRPKVEARILETGRAALDKFECDGTKTTTLSIQGAQISCGASKGF